MEDTNNAKMIDMAEVRVNWETNGIAYKQEGGSYEVVYYCNGDEESGVGRVYELDDAKFIAHAPRTIVTLAEEVARLQARCAELERDSADTLIEDLEQDVIARMPADEETPPSDPYTHGYNDGYWEAFDWVLERLKTYRKE